MSTPEDDAVDGTYGRLSTYRAVVTRELVREAREKLKLHPVSHELPGEASSDDHPEDKAVYSEADALADLDTLPLPATDADESENALGAAITAANEGEEMSDDDAAEAEALFAFDLDRFDDEGGDDEIDV